MSTATSTQHDQSGRPKVLIAGGGLGGLTMGMLLHKAGIPFEIYERAADVKPLGKAQLGNTHSYLSIIVNCDHHQWLLLFLPRSYKEHSSHYS